MKLFLLPLLLLLASCGKDTQSISVTATDGKDGANGVDGKDGENGKDGVQTKQGLFVNVHDLPAWTNVTLPELFVGNPVKGSFVLQNLNVGNSQSNQGFPGMPQELRDVVRDDGYSLDINGYLNVPTTGNYNFKLLSDDGVRLLINDREIINDDSLHSPRERESGMVRLNRGLNRINIIYYQGPHTQIALRLRWSGPNLSEQVVPSTSLSH